MPYAVYAIISPIDGQTVHYIGVSEDIARRFIEHLRGGADWIESLLAQGLLPICRTLETHDDKITAISRERYWVEVYRQQGMPLDNSMYPAPKKIAKKARKKISPINPAYQSAKLPSLDMDELKREIVRLHVEEGVPRGDILRRLHKGTQFYPDLIEALDEYTAQNPDFHAPTKKRRKDEETQ